MKKWIQDQDLRSVPVCEGEAPTGEGWSHIIGISCAELATVCCLLSVKEGEEQQLRFHRSFPENTQEIANCLSSWIQKYSPVMVVADAYDSIHLIRDKMDPDEQKLFIKAAHSASTTTPAAAMLRSWMLRQTLKMADDVARDQISWTREEQLPSGAVKLMGEVVPERTKSICSVHAMISAVMGYEAHREKVAAAA